MLDLKQSLLDLLGGQVAMHELDEESLLRILKNRMTDKEADCIAIYERVKELQEEVAKLKKVLRHRSADYAQGEFYFWGRRDDRFKVVVNGNKVALMAFEPWGALAEFIQVGPEEFWKGGK